MNRRTLLSTIGTLTAAISTQQTVAASDTESADGPTPMAELPDQYTDFAQTREEAVCTLVNSRHVEPALRAMRYYPIEPEVAKRELRSALEVLEQEIPQE